MVVFDLRSATTLDIADSHDFDETQGSMLDFGSACYSLEVAKRLAEDDVRRERFVLGIPIVEADDNTWPAPELRWEQTFYTSRMLGQQFRQWKTYHEVLDKHFWISERPIWGHPQWPGYEPGEVLLLTEDDAETVLVTTDECSPWDIISHAFSYQDKRAQKVQLFNQYGGYMRTYSSALTNAQALALLRENPTITMRFVTEDETTVRKLFRQLSRLPIS